jgi:cobalt-zinc-cadmium efflux system outer membrane protein
MALVALTMATALAHAQAPQAGAGLTLTTAIERALDANRTIAAARLQRPVDLAGIAVASERPNPEVAFEWSKETPKKAVGTAFPIELGGKRSSRIGLANATMAVTDAEVDRVIATVRNNVRRAYFDVVAADLRVQIADDVRALAQRARDAANARVTSGDVPRSDLTQADLTLANAMNDLVAARGEAAATRAELNALIGQPAGTPLTPADPLTTGAMMSVADAIALATSSNGELKVLDRRIEEQNARVKVAQSLQTPDISAGGTFTFDAEPEFRYGWRAAFGVTLPVFATHKAGVLVEQSALTKLKADREALVAEISGGIAAAVARATAARDQLASYQNTILPLAIEAERQAQVAYDGGQIGLTALVQALQIARETRQRGLQAGLDYQHALADLEKAIGAIIK